VQEAILIEGMYADGEFALFMTPDMFRECRKLAHVIPMPMGHNGKDDAPSLLCRRTNDRG
jgi:hypothetical protein